MLTRAAARAQRLTPAAARLTPGQVRSASGSEQTPLEVRHEPTERELSITLPGCRERAYLQYELEGSSVVDLQHTVVPESFRGRGVAKLLAKAAFQYVIEQDKKMRLTCWYLRKYCQDNPLPEYTSRVVE